MATVRFSKWWLSKWSLSTLPLGNLGFVADLLAVTLHLRHPDMKRKLYQILMGNPIPGISYCRVFGSLPINRLCKTDTNNEHSFKNAKRSSGRTGQILFISGPKTKLTRRHWGQICLTVVINPQWFTVNKFTLMVIG